MPDSQVPNDSQERNPDNLKDFLRELYEKLRDPSNKNLHWFSKEDIEKLLNSGFKNQIVELLYNKSFFQGVLFDEDDRDEVVNFCPASIEIKKRKDEYEQIQRISDGVAGIIRTDRLYFESGPNRYIVKDEVLTLKKRLKMREITLVDQTPFVLQPSLFKGTAFLVGKDLLLTAGHILNNLEIEKGDPIEHLSFVFGHKYDKNHNIDSHAFLKFNVYKGDHVVEKHYDPFLGDWALLKLKKEVSNYQKIVPIHFDFDYTANLRICSIGHPLGLPMKYTGNAQIKKICSPFIKASLDTFWGNSGSPILAQKNGKFGIVGIASSTSKDFAPEPKKCGAYKPYQLYSKKDENDFYMSCQLINDEIKNCINKNI